MRAACGRAPQGFREIPDSIVRAHNSCAQLIETGEPAADIFKNGGSATSRRDSPLVFVTRDACASYTPIRHTLAISYRD